MNRIFYVMGVWAMMMICCIQAVCAQVQMEVRRADGVGSSVGIWEKGSGRHYLFLPAYMEGQALEIALSGTESVSLGETVLSNGETTTALVEGARMTVAKDKSRITVMQSRNLPAVHLTTKSGSLSHIHRKKGNKEKGTIQIVTASGEIAYEGKLDTIKGHGNATFVYEKKSYQIKLEDKAAFLGMNKGKSYVLLANQHENSLVRNRLTFDLARALDLPYTPECRSVDLYVNGEYRGSYLLCDKVNISSGSVDITESEDALEFANEAFVERGGKPEPYGRNTYKEGTYKGAEWPREPEDVTGGFLFELEYSQRYQEETSGVVTERGQAIVVKEPEEMSRAQGKYARNLLESFDRAIFSSNGVDKESGKHYTEIADFDSLVRKYMIEEVSKNYDGNKSSQYFYKDSDAVDPLLYAGPVWDYDSAWGNYANKNRTKVAGPQDLSIARNGSDYSWWPALYRQEDFKTEVRRVYDSVLRGMLETVIGEREAGESVVTSLDAYEAELAASANMNFTRWRVLNHETRAIKTGASFEENIEYLRTWIKERMAYLDQSW